MDKTVKELIEKIVEFQEKSAYPGEKKMRKLISDTYKFLEGRDVKLFGGLAINEAVSKKDKIYPESEYPDIDCITYKPKKDGIELANYLFNKGHEDVSVVEGANAGVYKVRAYNRDAVDFSYQPKKVYDLIPVTVINNINYVSPEFLLIDLYKSLAFPENTWRWEKDFKRLTLLEKYVDFKEKSKIELKGNYDFDDLVKKIMKKTNAIVTGYYAVNLITGETNNVPYLEIIVDNYEKEKKNLDTLIKEKFPNKEITIKYHNILGKFYPKKFVYVVDGNNVMSVLSFEDYSLSCVGYYKIKGIRVTNYHFLMFYFLTLKYIGGIVGVSILERVSDYYCNHLYLLNKKKNFPIFQLECIGKRNDHVRENKIRRLDPKIKEFKYNVSSKKQISPDKVGTGEIPNYGGEIYYIQTI